jgi:hypothetical protein
MGGEYDWRIAQQLHSSGVPFDALIFAAILKADTQNMENLLIGFPDLVAEANRLYHGKTNVNLTEVEKLSKQYEDIEFENANNAEIDRQMAKDHTKVHFWETGCPLDNRHDEHWHSHEEWKAHLDREGK